MPTQVITGESTEVVYWGGRYVPVDELRKELLGEQKEELSAPL